MTVTKEQWDRYFDFSGHAVQQFIDRARPEDYFPRFVQDCLKDLVVAEGRFVADRPHWARSSNTATAYIQVGEFLFLILEPHEIRDETWKVVTVLNGAEGNSWAHAYAKGWTGLPPRPKKPRYAPPPPTLSRSDTIWQTSGAVIPVQPTAAIPRPQLPPILSITRRRLRRRLLKQWRQQKAAALSRQVQERDNQRAAWCWQRLQADDAQWIEAREYKRLYDTQLWPAYQAAYTETYARTRKAIAS